MTGTLLVVALDDHAAAHVIAAVRAHRRWVREQGYRMPEALDDLERVALAAFGGSGSDTLRQAQTAALGPVTPAATVEAMAVSTREAAAALGLSARTIARLIERDELASVKVGGSRRIPVAELERLAGATSTREDAP